MSAIPGGAVVFDITARAEGAKRAADDATNRIKKLQQDVGKTAVVVPAKVDVQRLQRDADRAKQIIREVQRDADKLSRERTQFRRGGGGGFGIDAELAGQTAPSRGGGRGGGRGGATFFGLDTGAGRGDALGRAAEVGTILRAGVLFSTAATEIALAARDMKAAAERGDLAGQVRAEAAKNAFAASMPFGIGKLGANIRELATGEQAGIDQTLFEAEQGNAKAAFMSRKNAEARAAQDKEKQDKVNAAKAQERAAQAAADRERLEGESNDRIAAIRDRAAADLLESQGRHVEAERARLVAGFMATEREMERAAQSAENAGDKGKAARLRAEAAAQKGADLGTLAAHDAEAAQREQDRRDQQDFEFQERRQRRIEESDRQDAEARDKIRRRTISELEDDIDRQRRAVGFPGGGAELNAANISFGRGPDREQLRKLDAMIELLKQLKDKDSVAFTS